MALLNLNSGYTGSVNRRPVARPASVMPHSSAPSAPAASNATPSLGSLLTGNYTGQSFQNTPLDQLFKSFGLNIRGQNEDAILRRGGVMGVAQNLFPMLQLQSDMMPYRRAALLAGVRALDGSNNQVKLERFRRLREALGARQAKVRAAQLREAGYSKEAEMAAKTSGQQEATRATNEYQAQMDSPETMSGQIGQLLNLIQAGSDPSSLIAALSSLSSGTPYQMPQKSGGILGDLVMPLLGQAASAYIGKAI